MFLVDFALKLFGGEFDSVVGPHTKFVKIFEFAIGAEGEAEHVNEDLLVGFFHTEPLAFNSKTHKSRVTSHISFVTGHINRNFF